MAGIACVPPQIAVIVARIEAAVQELRRPGCIDPVLRQDTTSFVDAALEVQSPEGEQRLRTQRHVVAAEVVASWIAIPAADLHVERIEEMTLRVRPQRHACRA